VGQNDSGKSNVLRALDLFFNEDSSYKLDWGQDFCAFAQVALKKAPEIEVSLTITPPANFGTQDPIIWKKVWRKHSRHKSEMKHPGRRDVDAQRNKFVTLLNSVRYDYVPAVKGEAYFSNLLGSMYDMLERTVEVELRDAAGKFTDAINSHTVSIVSELLEKLGLESTIELPPDLRGLFEQLDFRSSHQKRFFSLGQRGDGVKVRHVPIILRWLAEQAEVLKAPGRPRIVTVWGYEEPENNLEMSRCQEQAEEFLADSKRIQTFITTHSPAFYSIARKANVDGVKVFGVQKDSDGSLSQVEKKDPNNISELDTSMGLMPLIAPHFEAVSKELQKLKMHQESLPDLTCSTVFVEGSTDKMILEMAFEMLYPNAQDEVVFISKAGPGGGHLWVKDQIIAWAHSSPEAKAVALFDCDPDAISSRREAMKIGKVERSEKAKLLSLTKSDTLIRCARNGFNVPFAIEELFAKYWNSAEEKGWLEERPNLLTIYPFNDPSVSFDEYLEEKEANPLRLRLIRRRVKEFSKVRFARYICGKAKAQGADIFKGLQPTVDKIASAFGIEES